MKYFKTGSLAFLWNDYQGLAYARFSREEQMIVIINNRQDHDREVEIPVVAGWHQPAGGCEASRGLCLLPIQRMKFTEQEEEFSGICMHIARVNVGHRS